MQEQHTPQSAAPPVEEQSTPTEDVKNIIVPVSSMSSSSQAVSTVTSVEHPQADVPKVPFGIGSEAQAGYPGLVMPRFVPLNQPTHWDQSSRSSAGYPGSPQNANQKTEASTSQVSNHNMVPMQPQPPPSSGPGPQTQYAYNPNYQMMRGPMEYSQQPQMYPANGSQYAGQGSSAMSSVPFEASGPAGQVHPPPHGLAGGDSSSVPIANSMQPSPLNYHPASHPQYQQVMRQPHEYGAQPGIKPDAPHYQYAYPPVSYGPPEYSIPQHAGYYYPPPPHGMKQMASYPPHSAPPQSYQPPYYPAMEMKYAPHPYHPNQMPQRSRQLSAHSIAPTPMIGPAQNRASPVPNSVYTFESGVHQDPIDLVYIGIYDDVVTNKRPEALGDIIRVWNDSRKHLYYDCVCKKRKPIKNLKAMIAHANRHKRDSEQESFTCDICGRVFEHILGLNSHQRVHKPSSEQPQPTATQVPSSVPQAPQVSSQVPQPPQPPAPL
jgi:hypothetical protein